MRTSRAGSLVPKPAVSTRSKLRSHSITLSARASIALRFAGRGLTNLSQRLLVRINDAAGLLLGGREHRLIAHAAPGLEVRSFGDAVILDLQHSGSGPFAVFAEPDTGRHDGVELVGPQIIGDLVVVDALRSRDPGGEHLQIGISPAAQVIAERDRCLARALGIS